MRKRRRHLAGTSYGLVIGDFEGSLDGWPPKDATLTLSPIGATLGAGAMQVDGPGGWHIDSLLDAKGLRGELGVKGVTITADVTAFEADMTTTWMQVEFVINAQNNNDAGANNNVGWQGLGLQDVVRDGQPHKHTWVLPEALTTAIAGTDPNIWWFELALVSNLDGASVTKFYIDNIQVVPPPVRIIYVTDSPDLDNDSVRDDQSWIDWLTAQGYSVDARRGYWKEPLDANRVAELEAADLIIAGRGANTGNYDAAGEPAKWNSLRTPMLNTNVWLARKNRWLWMNNPTDAKKDAGSPVMSILDPNHPVFAGVTLDPNGLVNVLDPNVGSGNTSFLDMLDVGNGTLLAECLGVYNAAWIVEWPCGVEYYTGCGQVTGGKRILFSAGSQDTTLADESKTPQGVFNLNEAGQQMLRNAIAYLVAKGPMPVALVNASFELPGTEKIKGWNGEGVAGTPAVDIPGWASDTAVADSGVESDARFPATDGVWTGFLMGADPSVWQLTDFVIQANDVFELKVDAMNTWQGTTLKMVLYFDMSGIRIPAASKEATVTGTMQTFTLEFPAKDLQVSVGTKIGIELDNVTTVGDSWIGLDNVRLGLK